MVPKVIERKGIKLVRKYGEGIKAEARNGWHRSNKAGNCIGSWQGQLKP